MCSHVFTLLVLSLVTMRLPHHLAKLPSPVQLEALAKLLIMTFCVKRIQGSHSPSTPFSPPHHVVPGSHPASTSQNGKDCTGQDNRLEVSIGDEKTAGNSLIAEYLVLSCSI